MMAESPESQCLQIGACCFDPLSHELWREGSCNRLPRRLSQLLLRLAQAAPAVLTRQVLIDEVWERRMVEDDVLSRAIAELRKALGDDTRTPRYIETIPKAGYRLCAEVRRIESANDRSGLASTAAESLVPQASVATTDVAPRPRRNELILVALALVAVALVLLWLLPMSRPTVMHLGAADTARIRPFTSGPGWESRPDISPDGRWVAYSESEVNGSTSQLILQDFDGLHREVLESAAGFNLRPAFSPDGKQLAFLHFEAGRCALRLRSIPGGPGRSIADCAANVASTPAWSGDQRELIYTAVARADRMPGLAIVDVVSGTTRTLTQPLPTAGPDLDPESIPGQRAVSFARGFDGEQHLLRLELGVATATPTILFDAGRLQGHAWSADGAQLLVATDQPGYRTLVLLDPKGGAMEVLNTRGARYPAWAASHDLVFEVAQYDANIWRLELDQPELPPVAVVTSTRYDSSPALSADGKRIAFVSTRNDYEQIFIANADGSDQHKLSMPDGQRWSRPSFSPDGAFVLVTGYDQNNRHWIYRHELASGRNEQLKQLGEDASAGRYAPDGGSILYLRRNAGGTRDLWRIGLSSGDTPSRVAGGTDVDQFAIDGDLLAFTHSAQPGFRLLDMRSHAEARTLLVDVAPITPFAWTLRRRHLYAVVGAQGQTVLRRWDVDGGDGHTLAHDINADAIGSALLVSADEQTLWFARTDQVAIDLMVLPAPAK